VTRCLSLSLSLSLPPSLPRLPRGFVVESLVLPLTALLPLPPSPPASEGGRGNNNRERSKAAPLGGTKLTDGSSEIVETTLGKCGGEIPKSLTRYAATAMHNFPVRGPAFKRREFRRRLYDRPCPRRHSCRIPIGTQLYLFTRSLLGSPLLTTTTC